MGVGEGRQPPSQNSPIERIVKHHIHVVALAREDRIGDEQADGQLDTGGMEQGLLLDHPLTVNPSAITAEGKQLHRLKGIGMGTLLATTHHLDLGGGSAIFQRSPWAHQPLGIGEVLEQAAPPQTHQGGIQTRSSLQNRRELAAAVERPLEGLQLERCGRLGRCGSCSPGRRQEPGSPQGQHGRRPGPQAEPGTQAKTRHRAW